MISKIQGRLAYRLRYTHAFRTRTFSITSGTLTTLMKGHRGFSQFLENRAVSWLRQFVAGLLPQKPGFNPVPVNVVVEKKWQ
jgi:hypothetical protein